MTFRMAVGKSCTANRADTAGYEFNFIVAGGTKYLTGKGMQNFCAARTLRRENNFAYII
jgi:hypothetical protein